MPTTLTAKTFEFVADLISDIVESGTVTESQGIEIAQIAAENLRHTNPNFNKARFFRALSFEVIL